MTVSSFRRWTIKSQEGIDKGLEFSTDATRPTLGEEDVLVEIHAASLNARDLVILKVQPDRFSSPLRH
jgi:NADPH:quinone reductase-like Zn-dependent oxidoreductase